jgi:hypothetical protein
MLINENSADFNKNIGRNFLLNNDTHVIFSPQEDTSKNSRFEDNLRLGNGMDSFVSNLFNVNPTNLNESISIEG